MTIDWDLVAKVVAPTIAAFVGAFINRAIENRPRLVSWLGHTSSVTLRANPQSPLQVNTHAVVVRNTGRKPAKNVRLGHFVLPDFQVWPDIVHSVVQLPGGGQEILIPTLVPGEQVTVAYLYFPPLIFTQINSYTKSDDGFAKIITVLPTPQWPRWAQLLVWVLLVIGVGAIAYVLVYLIGRVLA